MRTKRDIWNTSVTEIPELRQGRTHAFGGLVKVSKQKTKKWDTI
jgi:hypothetical protein